MMRRDLFVVGVLVALPALTTVAILAGVVDRYRSPPSPVGVEIAAAGISAALAGGAAPAVRGER